MICIEKDICMRKSNWKSRFDLNNFYIRIMIGMIKDNKKNMARMSYLIISKVSVLQTKLLMNIRSDVIKI